MLALYACITKTETEHPKLKGYIGVSTTNTNYFAFSDGSPYIPIGINMVGPDKYPEGYPDSAFVEIEGWMKNLSANGGNYIRIWLSHRFWDIEESAGVYSQDKAERIDRFISLARKYKLRIKITLEHFRSITLEENNQPWATKFIYHRSRGGKLDSVRQYLASGEGRKLFLDKLDFYKRRYGADTLFFGWELWNEMNAMKGPEDSVFFSWNVDMLKAVKERFPENLVMQSLGSFDTESVRPIYQKMMRLPGNEVAQVHRYLDPGAPMPVCHESMDIIGSSAVEELLSYNLNKPVLLAETGAVEARHDGPSRYYKVDTTGIMLHDILFAPFFSGAAGTGMSWHWDSYVAKNNLWFHYKRFNEVVKGIDPILERFDHSVVITPELRIYRLKGKNTQLLWLRDKTSTWQSELADHQKPRQLSTIILTHEDIGLLNPRPVQAYDPWNDRWIEIQEKDGYYPIPSFQRSIIIKTILEN
ncbi:MAG: hypothetical protein ABJA70_08750 [Chryseolinea sp.]